MSIDTPPAPIREEDYEAIESAVMETARGRWFLKEYTRRHRSADTNMLLDAIGRLEKTITGPQPAHDVDAIRFDLADMASAIARTKDEISRLQAENDSDSQFARASSELDAIVGQTEVATSEILSAAETIQEVAWTLRENEVDEEACDTLDARSTEIYMACSFQDLTGQRIQKVVHVLKYLEGRINAMMDIWGDAVGEHQASPVDDPLHARDNRPDAHLLNGPQLDGEGVNQGDVDLMMSDASVDDMTFDAIDITPDETHIDQSAVLETVELDDAAEIIEPDMMAVDVALDTSDDLSAGSMDLAADFDEPTETALNAETVEHVGSSEVIEPNADHLSGESLAVDFSDAMADAGIELELDDDSLSFGERNALTQ